MKIQLMSHVMTMVGAIVALSGMVTVVAVTGGNVEQIIGFATPTLVALLALLKGDQNENVSRKVEKHVNGELDARMRRIMRETIAEQKAEPNEVKDNGRHEL